MAGWTNEPGGQERKIASLKRELGAGGFVRLFRLTCKPYLIPGRRTASRSSMQFSRHSDSMLCSSVDVVSQALLELFDSG